MELGLTSEAFYSLTPREYDALCVRHKRKLTQRDEMLELMMGQLIAKVHNVSMAGCKDPISPEDVMPSRWGQEREPTEEEQEEGLASIRRAMTRTGGWQVLNSPA